MGRRGWEKVDALISMGGGFKPDVWDHFGPSGWRVGGGEGGLLISDADVIFWRPLTLSNVGMRSYCSPVFGWIFSECTVADPRVECEFSGNWVVTSRDRGALCRGGDDVSAAGLLPDIFHLLPKVPKSHSGMGIMPIGNNAPIIDQSL